MKKVLEGLFSKLSLKNKYLSLVIVTALLSFGAHAQYDSTKILQDQSSYGFRWKNGDFKSSFKIPTDTTKLAVKDSGAIAYKGGIVWSWNGHKWTSTGSGGPGGGQDTALAIYPLRVDTTGGVLKFYLDQGFSDSLGIFFHRIDSNYVSLTTRGGTEFTAFSPTNGGALTSDGFLYSGAVTSDSTAVKIAGPIAYSKGGHTYVLPSDANFTIDTVAAGFHKRYVIWGDSTSTLHLQPGYTSQFNVADPAIPSYGVVIKSVQVDGRDRSTVVGGTVLDTIPRFAVIDSVGTLPGSPSLGDKYLVGTGAHANQVATFGGVSYTYQTAATGDLLYRASNGIVSKWTGTAWVRVGKLVLHQKGDGYGQTIEVGSTDNYTLNFLQNGIPKMWISASDGRVKILNGATLTTSGANLEFVDGNSTIGIGSGGNIEHTSLLGRWRFKNTSTGLTELLISEADNRILNFTKFGSMNAPDTNAIVDMDGPRGFLPPRLTATQRTALGSNVNVSTLIAGGNGYPNGVNMGVPLTCSCGGTNAVATLSVTGGVVSLKSLTNGGRGFHPDDILTSNLGGGSGLQIKVNSVGSQATTVFDTNDSLLYMYNGVVWKAFLGSTSGGGGSTITFPNTAGKYLTGYNTFGNLDSIRTHLGITAPLTYNSSTGVFGITQATTSTNGYVSSTDWNIFNNNFYRSDGTFLSNRYANLGGNSVTFYNGADNWLSIDPANKQTLLLATDGGGNYGSISLLTSPTLGYKSFFGVNYGPTITGFGTDAQLGTATVTAPSGLFYNTRAGSITNDSIVTINKSTNEFRSVSLQSVRADTLVSSNVEKSYLLVGHGDSQTAGGYTTWLSALSGMNVIDRGIGGQTSTQIAVRQGGISTTATVVGGSIPASGGVTVTFPTGFEPVTRETQGPVYGTISGVYGALTISGTVPPITFTRVNAGSIVSVASATWIPDNGILNSGGAIIWVGRNNLTDTARIKTDIAGMVASLGHTQYMIISIVNDSTEKTGTAALNKILAIDTSLSRLYPGHYVDWYHYSLTLSNGSAQDNYDVSNGVPPTSLRVDNLHPNTLGKQQLANLIYANIGMLQKPSKVVTGNDLAYFQKSPGVIGSVNASSANFTTVSTKAPTAAYQAAFLDSTLVNSTGFTSTNWTGSYPSYTHSTGNTSALSRTMTTVVGNSYDVSWTVTGRTAGTFTVGVGGVTEGTAYSATGEIGLQSTSTSGALTFTPTSTFDGTISNIKVRLLQSAIVPIFTAKDTSGQDALQVRISPSALHNTLIGKGAGSNLLTAISVTAIGDSAAPYTTHGSNVTAIGRDAAKKNVNGNTIVAVGNSSLLNNVSGINNVGIGSVALLNWTGNNTVAIGNSAGRTPTAGNTSTFIGNSAGDNASQLTSVSNDIVIGYNAYGNRANQTVIGQSTVSETILAGNVGIGMMPNATTINTPTSTLTVNGSFAPGYRATATSSTATASDNTIEISATGQTVTLPTAVGITGREYTIILTAVGTGTVATTSSQNINTATTYSLSSQGKYVTVVSNGTQFWVKANN